MEKGPGKGGQPASRARKPGGEQFADPLAWTPEMRPSPPPSRSVRDEEADHREREINRRIVEEYGGGPLDSIKPLVGIALLGLIVFSLVDRKDMVNATIYAAMAMGAVGAIYTMACRDTMPPLVSLVMKGLFGVGMLAAAVWFVATHSESFTGKDAEGKTTYRAIRDEVLQDSK
jgi:hypothetical protein